MATKAKAIYNAKGHVLGRDAKGHLNYVEPHGTTTHCPKCRATVEHANIPFAERNAAGTVYLRK